MLRIPNTFSKNSKIRQIKIVLPEKLCNNKKKEKKERKNKDRTKGYILEND